MFRLARPASEAQPHKHFPLRVTSAREQCQLADRQRVFFEIGFVILYPIVRTTASLRTVRKDCSALLKAGLQS
jgi:hypothetical protein